MDEDEDDDKHVWNAMGVILDIDSGVLFFFFAKFHQMATASFSSSH